MESWSETRHGRGTRMTTDCACGCGVAVEQPTTGRPRLYAAEACKQRAKRKRRRDEERVVDAERTERERAAREVARAEAVALLEQIPEPLFAELVARWSTVKGAVAYLARVRGLPGSSSIW